MYGLVLYFDVYCDDFLGEWEKLCLQKSVLYLLSVLNNSTTEIHFPKKS